VRTGHRRRGARQLALQFQTQLNPGFAVQFQNANGIGDPLRLIVFAALGVLSAAAVTQLAYRVYESAVAAVLAAIGCLVPYLSLVVMLVVNQSATKKVKAAGYQVGLLGADPKQFD
jgi:hypothetical protein